MGILGIVEIDSIPAVVSTVNSSTTPLGGGATFTGTGEEVTHFAMVQVFVRTDQPSATDGLSLEFSPDGTNWDDVDTYTVAANNGKFFTLPTEARFFRVRYTNGATPQGAFRLQTILRKIPTKTSSHSLREVLTDENDAELVRAIISGKNASGNYVNASFDDQNRLVVTTAAASATLAGFVAGYVATAATTRVPVRATTYTEQSSNFQGSVASSSVNDTSAGTGARTIRITYYTATFTGPFTEDVTLNGTGNVNLVNTNHCYIERIEVLTAGSGLVNAGTITLRTGLAGGGTVVWTVAAGNNRTYSAHHYVPTGKTAKVTGISVGHNGTVVGSGALFTINALTLGVANAIDKQVSDFVRLYGQSSTFARSYASPIEVVGPARLTTYVTPESTGSLQFRAAIDFYEQTT